MRVHQSLSECHSSFLNMGSLALLSKLNQADLGFFRRGYYHHTLKDMQHTHTNVIVFNSVETTRALSV